MQEEHPKYPPLRAFVNLVAVEAPAAGVAYTREPLEFFDATFRAVFASYGLQVDADSLIELLAQGFGIFADSVHGLIVNEG